MVNNKPTYSQEIIFQLHFDKYREIDMETKEKIDYYSAQLKKSRHEFIMEAIARYIYELELMGEVITHDDMEEMRRCFIR